MKFNIENDSGELVHSSEGTELLGVKFIKEEEALNYQVLMFSDKAEGNGGMSMFRVLQAWEQITRLLLGEGEQFEVDDLADDLKRAIDKNKELIKSGE